VPGWTRHGEATTLAHESYALPDGAVVVEIGSFLGCSAVLLAGARKLRGSGKVHCIDPFDASGDEFSVPIYRTIRGFRKATLRERFDKYVERAGVSDFVQVHPGLACLIGQDGREVYLRQKTFQTLLFLLEQRHRVVSKDEIAAKIWPDTALDAVRGRDRSDTTAPRPASVRAASRTARSTSAAVSSKK